MPLRPHVFDRHAEPRQLQLTLATPLPPVCLVHGQAAVEPKEQVLRFWGKPGAYRQEGVGRLLWELPKSALGVFVIDRNEPLAIVKARWPECERCAARADARVKKLIVYYVGSLVPLCVGVALMFSRPSAFAMILCAAGVGLVLLAVMLGSVVFARTDRYLEAALAPDASSVTVCAHPDFARSWSGQEQR
ncbi:hypothetical protein DFR71_5309 [Nocardia alba]|uniref:Uncharacterized protein n=1 Tax=Nocardia alba TaxID=225051 RepID=A0A4R1FGK5_9NOCA|nr:hypothetical protein DFR71_5309 [Nocardia alba]